MLLDIGCGNGAFAEFAASVGYEVIGIDVDAASIKIAQSRDIPGANFRCCSLKEFCSSLAQFGKFDVITMFEVFEHLDNPQFVLKLVERLLRGQGLFVGSLPNTERVLMWWLNMDYELPPYHLTYWTTRSWSEFLNRNFSFDVLCCESSRYYGYMSDVLLNRYRLPSLFGKLISNFLYPVEFKLESYYKVGASFYFEAMLNRT